MQIEPNYARDSFMSDPFICHGPERTQFGSIWNRKGRCFSNEFQEKVCKHLLLVLVQLY